MKFVFLDIDGVLNHQEFYTARTNQTVHQNYPYSEFDPVSVAFINRIVEETDAKIILSSDWRFQTNIDEIFKTVGLPKIYDKTPYINGQHKDEIEAYVKKYPEVLDYIIIDDCKDFYKRQKPYLISTNAGQDGLNERLTIKSIDMLNRTKKPSVLVVKPILANFSNFTEEDSRDNIAFLRIYLHGKIQSKFPNGDQVCIKNITDFDTYTVKNKFIGDEEPREFQQIDFEGKIPCKVIGIDECCTAFLWKSPVFSDNQYQTIGLICQNDDEWAMKDARKKLESKSLVL